MAMANNAGQRTNTFGRHKMAAPRQIPVIQAGHFFSTDRKANSMKSTVTIWLKKLSPVFMDSHQYTVPNEKSAVSQIAPERDNWIQPVRMSWLRMRYIVTAAKAASTRENVVMLKASVPHIATKGRIRMIGKGG